MCRTLGTPVDAIHLHAFLCQASRKGIVPVRVLMVEKVIGAAQCEHNDQPDDHLAQEGRIPFRLFFVLFLSLPFSPLLRHKSFYTTTRRTEGSTSSFWRCKVRASPSTITSTGASSSNSILWAAWRSANGCFTWVPS